MITKKILHLATHGLTAAAALCLIVLAAPAMPGAASPSGPPSTRLPLLAPPDAIRIPCENVEGALLLRATVASNNDLDTTGTLVLDTGAGYLALSPSLIRWLQLSTDTVEPMTFAARPVQHLEAGDFRQDVVGPVLGVDTRVIEQATDRKVLGLLGYEPLSSFALRIDYRADTLALIPIRRDGIAATPAHRVGAAEMAAASAAFLLARNASRDALGASLGTHAIPLPFEILGDGKIVLAARAGSSTGDRSAPPLTMVLDTGATKTVIFLHAYERARETRPWPELHGLAAPTLYGSEDAYISRVPVLSATGAGEAASAEGVDVAVMESDLEQALSQAIQRPVDGLLGYSFLRRFRVTIDYPHRVLWLEPVAVGRDQRAYEYSHVGVQIERRDGALRIVAVADKSPAADAGIRTGDELVGVDGADAASLDLGDASARLEGPPGTKVRLRVRRGSEVRSYRLTRRALL